MSVRIRSYSGGHSHISGPASQTTDPWSGQPNPNPPMHYHRMKRTGVQSYQNGDWVNTGGGHLPTGHRHTQQEVVDASGQLMTPGLMGYDPHHSHEQFGNPYTLGGAHNPDQNPEPFTGDTVLTEAEIAAGKHMHGTYTDDAAIPMGPYTNPINHAHYNTGWPNWPGQTAWPSGGHQHGTSQPGQTRGYGHTQRPRIRRGQR